MGEMKNSTAESRRSDFPILWPGHCGIINGARGFPSLAGVVT